ncbi:MAG: porin family protein [Proteobacteria bacterium]|nr:porin family protein [Pseudomonadota bacterium]MBU1737910.1 porin family protein [Pseudomonadota bacterium]
MSGIICLVSFFVTTSATAADFAVMVKSGAVNLWDDKQRLDGVQRDFDDSGNKIFSIGWEIRNQKNVGLGMEYTNFKHEFTPPASTGMTRTQVYLFTAKKYFVPHEMIRPFFGIGLGWGHAKYDDGIGNVDRDMNAALQASMGIEFLFAENFGFYTELKGLASNTDGESENEFDFSSTGLMAGVSFVF